MQLRSTSLYRTIQSCLPMGFNASLQITFQPVRYHGREWSLSLTSIIQWKNWNYGSTAQTRAFISPSMVIFRVSVHSAIGQLTKLKKLKMRSFIRADFHIHSASLEDTRSSSDDFFIAQFVCPSLKVFRCDYKTRISTHMITNGILRPVFPFTGKTHETKGGSWKWKLELVHSLV